MAKTLQSNLSDREEGKKSSLNQKKGARDGGTIPWPWAQMLKSNNRAKQPQEWRALVREEKLAARGIDLEQVCMVQLQIYTYTHETRRRRNEIAKAFSK